MNTPWGESDSVRDLGAGVLAVTTAGHGGLFVPDELLARIPADQRKWAERWSGSQNWYEEDCCWAAVAAAFPALFKGLQNEARATLARAGFIPQERPL